jgi:hypothetical protein
MRKLRGTVFGNRSQLVDLNDALLEVRGIALAAEELANAAETLAEVSQSGLAFCGNNSSSPPARDALLRDVRCLKHEMKKLKRSGTHSELLRQADAAIRCLRGDMKCLKYEVKRLKHTPIAQPDVPHEVGLLRKDVRCLKHELRKLIQEPGVRSGVVQKDLRCLKHEMKKLKCERELAEEDANEQRRTAIVKQLGREEGRQSREELERLRREIEELRGRVRQLEEEPDLSQVFVELPEMAAVQLVFRTEQPVQGD